MTYDERAEKIYQWCFNDEWQMTSEIELKKMIATALREAVEEAEDVDNKLYQWNYNKGKAEAYADASKIADDGTRNDSGQDIARRIRARAQEMK